MPHPPAHSHNHTRTQVAVPFLAERMDELAREKVAWLRSQMEGYLQPRGAGGRLQRGAAGGAKDFPDIGDVHDVLFGIPLTAVAAEKLKDLWNLFDKNKDGVSNRFDKCSIYFVYFDLLLFISIYFCFFRFAFFFFFCV
jgi:hypothetical protein